MMGPLSERKAVTLEFCHGVKVELIKCWTTSQFKFTFNSLLGNMFSIKLIYIYNLFLSVKSEKTVYIRKQQLVLMN